jgi:hypothetical protein
MSTLQATNLKNAASASNNIVLDASGNATFAGTAAMASSFLRNRIINGNMAIRQRGTSFTATAGTAIYTADRWLVFATGASCSVSTPSDLGLAGFPTGLLATGATGNTVLNFAQRIESVNILDLANQTVTISGWLFSTATVTPTLSLTTPNAVDNYSSETAVGSVPALPSVPANTWTRFAVSVALPAAAANGLQVVVAWGATGAGVNRYLTGVQLEVGTVATPFERRQYGQEFALCQRYFERSDQLFQTASNGGLSNSYPTGIYYQVTKRAPATVTIYSGGSLLGTAGSATWYPTGVVGAVNPETNNTTGYMFSRVGINTYTLALFSYTASAEL